MKNAEFYRELFFLGNHNYWFYVSILFRNKGHTKNQYLILFFVVLVGMTVYLSVTAESLKLHNERTKQLNRIEENQVLLMKALEKDIKVVKKVNE